jgi:hypothetical protein
MSLAEKWSVSTFYYDKGFYDGAKTILSMLHKASTLSEVENVVTNLGLKFKELEAVHAVIVEKNTSAPVECPIKEEPKAKPKAKKVKAK